MNILFKDRLERAKVFEKGHFNISYSHHADTIITDRYAIARNPYLFKAITKQIGVETIRLKVEATVILSNTAFETLIASQIACQFGQHFAQITKKNEKYAFENGFDEIVIGKDVILFKDFIFNHYDSMTVSDIIYHASMLGATINGVVTIWDGFGFNAKTIPTRSIIKDKIGVWEKNKCPLCAEGIGLVDAVNKDI